MRLPRHLRRPDIITSRLTEPADIFPAADERPAAPALGPARLPWAWAGSVVLHLLALALVLCVREKPLPQPEEAPASISVTLDTSGEQQTTAPPAPTPGPPQLAQAPALPPPPPPPPAPQPPEVNLNVPPNLLATLPPPTPRPHPVAPRRPAVPHYAMMLNGMSYGSPSPAAPAPPAHQAMNMQLPQSDAQAVMGPAVTVKGDVGADWMAALTDWVNRHAYYPQAAVEQQQQGTAEVIFNVDRNGHVTGLRLVRSAGSPFLDQAWEQLFLDNQLPPFPPDAKDDHATVDYTVHYQLVP